jgi:hypothetical protein
VSWLRASRKVVDPEGVRWDVYVTRITVADTGSLYDERNNDNPLQSPEARIEANLIEGVFVAFGAVLRMAIRLVLLLPTGLMRSRFGMTWRIEAISDWPHELVRVWTVQGKPGQILLDEIARGLALGNVPEPVGATYLGEKAR